MYYNMSGTIPPGNGYMYSCNLVGHVCMLLLSYFSDHFYSKHEIFIILFLLLMFDF